MTKALRLHVAKDGIAGGYDVVTASDLREMGRLAARELYFVCAHPDCHIKVLPVFPKAVGKDGKIPECHFRALPGVHHIGHGAPSPMQDKLEGPSYSRRRSSTQPSGWRDPSLPKQSATSASTSNTRASTNLDHPDGKTAGRTAKTGTNTENSTTSVLQKLADRWESEQPQILEEKFTFPDAKGLKWKDMFLQIGDAASEREINQLRRRFFYGEVCKVNRWGSQAFQLEFLRQICERKVACYAKMPPSDQEKHPILASRLKKLAKSNKGRAYVLGRLVTHKDGFLEIVIESYKYLWVVT